MAKTILLLVHNWDYRPMRPYKVGLQLSKRGYKVLMLLPSERLTLGYRKECVSSNFSLYFCPTILRGGLQKGSDPLDLVTKLFLVRKLAYDLIFAFDSRPTVILPAVYGKSVKGVPLILDWTDWFGRGGIISERSGRIYRFFFEKIETFFEEHYRCDADSSTVICTPLSERLKGLGYQGKIHRFPLGCDPVVATNGETRALRQCLNLPADVPLIGYVGTMLRCDAALLFASFEKVRHRIEARLVLIGKNNLKDHDPVPPGVIRTGRVSREELEKYVHCCDLMVLPLRNNVANNGRWPSKLNDYLVMGKPIVSTAISVVRELLEMYEFGVLAKDTPEDFAEKICGMMNDSKKMNLYRNEALRLASDHLSWPRLIDQLDEFIQETMAYCS